MNRCCCTAPARPPCFVCSEGSNVSIDRYPGFVIDGSQFVDVTDIYPQATSIPGGCVNAFTGHSTVCTDVLNREWTLSRLDIGHRSDGTCADYFGNTIACDAVVCWWYARNTIHCPDNCNYSPDIRCPYNNDVVAEFIVDASSDPDYILLYIMITMEWQRYWCCLTGDITGAPYSQMLVTYRVPKADFTCLCPVCFAKVGSEMIHDSPTGEGIPCLNFPDHLRVTPKAAGATAEQVAQANTRCSSPDYQVNIDCAVTEGCGHTLCVYEAQDTGGSLEWVYVSGVCIEGCICPDHATLIARGTPAPKYAGQSLSIDTDCMTGDRPCSTILGRCCYVDGTDARCVDNIDECDCYSEYSGCWDVGTGITCANPDAGFCNCTTPVGICCYADETGDHCLDDVTESYCSEVSSGTGGWVQQNEAGDFKCNGDHAGLSHCGPGCNCSNTFACGYLPTTGDSPTGWIWYLDTDDCSWRASYCSCATVDDAFYALHGYPDATSGSLFVTCSGC